MESVTIRRTAKGVWQKQFDDYEKSFRRISKKEALESIKSARERGVMYYDSDENEPPEYFKHHGQVYTPIYFGYWN